MAKTNWQDPKTSEMRSTHVSGLMEAVGKVEDSIGMESVFETNVPLTEVFISSDDRYRIFQAPEGKRNWTAEQAPVIKRNGSIITSGFEIDYGGGAIILNVNDTVENTYTADVTYIKTSKVRKLVRFVIGTSTSGWTEKDCDYLCDGVDDQVEINQAIQDLPTIGGEIVLLDGTYSISLWVLINKSNVTLRGNGWSTIIRRDFTAGINQGAIAFSGDNVSVRDLVVDANKDNYGGNRNYGITTIISDNDPNNCTIKGLLVKNSTNAGISIYGNNSTIINNTVINSGTGLRSSGKNNIFSNNIVLDNDVGMYLQNSEGNLITSNIFMRGTGLSSDYTTSQYTIRLAATNNHYNLIASNFCMGKAPVVEGGTGNSAWGNKFDNTDDLP